MHTVDFDLILKIRKHIDRPEKQSKLLKNQEKWGRITAALDVLEDASWAIKYYVDADYPEDMRGKYLYTYGVLQALFAQQDAMNGIYKALFGKELKYDEQNPGIFKVREIRNDVIGHPTDRGKCQFIHLVQISMEKKSFYYMKYDTRTLNTEHVDVGVFEAIEENAKGLNDLLSQALTELDLEFKEYIEMHKDRKMSKIFSQLIYAREKVLTNAPMADWGYSMAKRMLTQFEEELLKRYGDGCDAPDGCKHLVIEIKETFALLDEGISKIPVEWQDKMREKLHQYLFVKLEELEICGREIDEYFENYGGKPLSEDTDRPNINIIVSGAE